VHACDQAVAPSFKNWVALKNRMSSNKSQKTTGGIGRSAREMVIMATGQAKKMQRKRKKKTQVFRYCGLLLEECKTRRVSGAADSSSTLALDGRVSRR